MRLPRGCCMPCSLACPRDDRALWWPAAMAEAALFASASGSASRHFITRSSSRPVQGRGRRGRPARRTAGWRECVGRGGQPAVSGPLTSRLVGGCLPRVVPGRWPGRAGTAHRRFIDLRGSRPRSSLAHPFYFLKLFFLFFLFQRPFAGKFRRGAHRLAQPFAVAVRRARTAGVAVGSTALHLAVGLVSACSKMQQMQRPARVLAGWLAGRPAAPPCPSEGNGARGPRGGAGRHPSPAARRPDPTRPGHREAGWQVAAALRRHFSRETETSPVSACYPTRSSPDNHVCKSRKM